MRADEDLIDQEIGEATSLLARLRYLALVGLLIAIAVIGLYFYNFDGGLSDSHERWGQFGDYVGGLLNPTLSLLALIALLATVTLQVRELRMSARDLKNSAEALVKQNEAIRTQNFEASFFQLLRLHNDIVNAVDLVSQQGRLTKGRDCFRVFLERLENGLSKVTSQYPGVGM